MEDIAAALPKILSIFSLAFFYFWAAIPAGLAFGLSPLVVILTTSLSYISGVALVTLAGERVRAWIFKRLGKKTTLNPDSLAGRIWERAGVAGLGLAAPVTVGAQMGAAIGIALNARPRHLFFWMCAGAVAWSLLLTVLTTMGVIGVQEMMK
jgi:hypothetical protein